MARRSGEAVLSLQRLCQPDWCEHESPLPPLAVAAHVTPGAHDDQVTAFIHPLNRHVHRRTSSSSFALAVRFLAAPHATGTGSDDAPHDTARRSPLQAPPYQGLSTV